MTIGSADIHHSITGVEIPKATGIFFEAYLIDLSGTVVTIKATLVTITKSKTKNTITITAKADNNSLGDVLDIVSGSTLHYSIGLVGYDGSRLIFYKREDKITDFRTDAGATSTSYTLDADSTVIDGLGASISINEVFTETKYSVQGIDYAEYNVDPTLFRDLPVKGALSVKGVSVVLESKILVMYPEVSTLTIKVKIP